MRMRSVHKLVTNSNGNASSAMGSLIAMIGIAVIVGLIVSAF